MATVIIDYGVGNLFSIKRSLLSLGESAVVSDDAEEILAAERLILPGVGAFGDAARKLRDTGLGETAKTAARRGIPILGICLGMQLLFERGFEFGEHVGLGIIPGEVRSVRESIPSELKTPHIGWNALLLRNKSRIYENTSDAEFVYFVHSYHAVCPERYITAVTEYGAELTASVQNDNVFGAQYHPEKSGAAGLRILSEFTKVS